MKTLRGLFCIVDPDGHPIHTHLGTKPEEVIESYLDEERVIRGTLFGRVTPSWEIFEAEGYTIQKVDLVPHIHPMMIKSEHL